MHEIIKTVVLITFKGAKINELHFPLYGGSRPGSPCSGCQEKDISFNFYIEMFNL